MFKKKAKDHHFDFNTGYLVKSPCKGCATWESFPRCMEECEILRRIQMVLSDSLPSANNYSAAETFEMPLCLREQK
jgi:hypothetical protein